MALLDKKTIVELCIRFFLILLFIYTEKMEPFIRIIQKEEWWLYSYPYVKHTAVSTKALWIITIFAPLMTIVFFSGILKSRRNHDFMQAFLCISLVFAVNGLLTNMVKLMVGRPRPDFFKRCFPSGAIPMGQPSVNNLICSGDPQRVKQGRKSFPSGHSSYAFSTFGFCSLYIAGKLHLFTTRGRGYSIRLILSLIPLCLATMVAISRTCDYRHHWQDVVVGSALGFTVTYFIYFQYYPDLTDQNSHVPLWSRNRVRISADSTEGDLVLGQTL